MNVSPLVWRACSYSGEFDSRLWLALRSELTFGDLLDVLELQDATADWREAERKRQREDADRRQAEIEARRGAR